MVLLIALIACDFFTPQLAVADPDGDGVTLDDCAEHNASVYPGAREAWYDGVDQDCDGNDGDQDGDGFVPPDYALLHPAWTGFPAHAASGDCWDDPIIPYLSGFTARNGARERPEPATVHPDATELWYDGVDANCDRRDDFDQDGDGYTSAWHSRVDGSSGSDCVDGSSEDPDFVDADGDAVSIASVGLGPADIHPGLAEDRCYDGIDADCAYNDDYDCDGDGVRWDEECDDTNPTALPNPALDDVWYDGVDQDCDGNDADQDGDGYVPFDVIATYATLGLLWEDFPKHLGTGDCWDDPFDQPIEYTPSLHGYPDLYAIEVYPGAFDYPYDGVDADCQLDDDFDNDEDGEDTNEYSQRDGSIGTDCDDRDPTVNTRGEETCATASDDDCDGTENDVGALGCVTWYADADQDGHGSADARCICTPEGVYRAAATTDCDDTRATAHPGAAEHIADGIDQDCSGGDTCYQDLDGDGFGSAQTLASPDLGCDGPGEATNHDDCDDADSGVHPDAADVGGDGQDQNCDGWDE